MSVVRLSLNCLFNQLLVNGKMDCDQTWYKAFLHESPSKLRKQLHFAAQLRHNCLHCKTLYKLLVHIGWIMTSRPGMKHTCINLSQILKTNPI